MLRAEIISVGTELLLGQILDTHAPRMAQILAECGIGCQRRATIGDNRERLVEALRSSLGRCDVVITIGGLGPTMDDLTRECIAEALGDTLSRDADYEASLRKWFADRNYPFTENNAKQADVPASGRMIPNPNGTAPGLLCEKDGRIVIAMPGPKGEFNPMAEGYVRTFLSQLGGGVIHSRVLRVIGIGESKAETLLADLMEAANPTVAPYAHTGEVHLRITAQAASVAEADTLIDPVAEEIRRRLGTHVFGTDLTTLEETIVQELLARDATVAVAESMTGGQLAARFTAVPGVSQVFLGGVVAYTAAAKSDLVGVSPDLIAAETPVSEAVAIALASGIQERLGATYGVGITGNAGPSSDEGGKPVGLTYVAVASPDGVRVDQLNFRGTREDIQRRATQVALDLLRNTMLDRSGG